MKIADLPLFAAPHRGFFLLGISGFVLLIGAWLLRFLQPAASVLPAPWLHAWLMSFGALAPFIAGFLFTAYSRWLGAEPPSRACWLGSLGLQAGGIALLALSAAAGRQVALAATVLLLGGWLLVLGHLLRALVRGNGAALHARSMVFAVSLGLIALLLQGAWLAGGDPRLAMASVPVGFWGFLLCVYLVVAHRMIPFFAGCVLKPYQPYRPAWALLALLALALVHMTLKTMHFEAWLWLADLPLALLAAYLAWRWEFRRSGAHRLLAALFIAWIALVVGMLASAAQSLAYLASGNMVAPYLAEHLVGVCFFSAMVVAMGTRVTLGHSGRALLMNPVAWWALLVMVLAGLVRAASEFGAWRQELLFISAVLWLAAAAAWAARHAPMLIGPRVDR
jgi:uncharacterized protein involved in response to NO